MSNAILDRKGATKMKSICPFAFTAAILAIILSAAAVRAENPSAASELDKMRAALEPSRPSTRDLTFTFHSAAFDENTQITAREARKTFADGARSVMVVTGPETAKGVALLMIEEKDKPNVEYLYFPALRRVRRLSGPGRFEPFLGSDFTYADLGLVDVHDRALKLLGAKSHDGAKVYELEETPRKTWYYSRIVDWIAMDSGLPLERDHFDAANELWRKQVYDHVQTVDGVPTPMHVRVDDLESRDWSAYDLSNVHYGVALSDDLFDPAKLANVAQASDWHTAGAPAVTSRRAD
jgi:Outer membrane lipoprotein-sorting protein